MTFVPGENLIDAGSLPITGYEVQYQLDDDDTDDGVSESWSGALTEVITTPTTTNFIHKNVEGGTVEDDDGGDVIIMWAYRVRAVNGNGPGEYSTVSRVSYPSRAPAAPELTATVMSASQIRLEWNVPANNGTDITGYVIQQLNDDGSAWGTDDLLDGDDEGVTEDANRTLFVVDEMLLPNTTYYYRIRAQTNPVTVPANQKWSGGTTETNLKIGAATAKTMAGKPSAPVLEPALGDAHGR